MAWGTLAPSYGPSPASAPLPEGSCIFLGMRPFECIQPSDGAGLYGDFCADLITFPLLRTTEEPISPGWKCPLLPILPTSGPCFPGCPVVLVTHQVCGGLGGRGLGRGRSWHGHLDSSELPSTLCVSPKRAFWRWTGAWSFPFFLSTLNI